MAQNVQWNEIKIDFDTKITTEIDNVSACREILQNMLNNGETADVILVAGDDGVKLVVFSKSFY